MDKVDWTDVKYSVKIIDPVQVTDITSLPLNSNSSSSPPPERNGKRPVSHCDRGETKGQDLSTLSLMSPTIFTPNVVDTNEPDWIPSLTQEKFDP